MFQLLNGYNFSEIKMNNFYNAIECISILLLNIRFDIDGS